MLWHTYTTRSGRFEQKFLGIYATKHRAQAAKRRLLIQPGFRRWPDGFAIVRTCLDHPELNTESLTPQGGKPAR